VPRPWSILDFFLIVLGGVLTATIFGAFVVVFEDNEVFFVLALIGQYAGHLLALWLIARKKGYPDFGFSVEGRDILYLGSGLFLQLALAVLFFPLTSLLLPEGDSAQQVATDLAGLETTAARIAAVVIAVVLAPVTEEIIFRGVLLKSLGERRPRVIMALTALIFAFFHLIGLQPDRMLQAAAVVLPQLFIVGVVLAWVTIRTKRLGPAIFIHSGFNLLAAIVLLLPPELLESVG
jgi:hypothetical protein